MFPTWVNACICGRKPGNSSTVHAEVVQSLVFTVIQFICNMLLAYDTKWRSTVKP